MASHSSTIRAGGWVELIEEQDRIFLDRTAVRLQAPVDRGALALSSTAPILVSLAGAHRRAVRHLLGRQLQRTPAHAQGRAPPSPRVAVQLPRRGPARPARAAPLALRQEAPVEEEAGPEA